MACIWDHVGDTQWDNFLGFHCLTSYETKKCPHSYYQRDPKCFDMQDSITSIVMLYTKINVMMS